MDRQRNPPDAPAADACPLSVDAAAWVQSELDAVAAREFESHLVSCADCRDRVDALRRVVSRLQEGKALPPRRDLVEGVMSAIPAQEWEPARVTVRWNVSSRFWWRVAAAALLLVGTGLAVLHWSRGGSSSPLASSAAVKEPVSNAVQAVAGALRWLTENQESDGHWDAKKWDARQEFTAGLTALSALALISGSAAAVPPARDAAVRSAMEYLVSHQDEKGRIGQACSGDLYNHGLATLALLTALRQLPTPPASWRTAADRAVGFIAGGQLTDGGWGYTERPGGDAAPSVTIWQLLALIRADADGWAGLRPRIEKGVASLAASVAAPAMSYSASTWSVETPFGGEALTAAGLLYLSRLDDRSVDRVIVMKMRRIVKKQAIGAPGGPDNYRAYFLAAALASAGDDDAWPLLERLRVDLIARQTHEGPLAGTWGHDDRWAVAGGRVYATAMGALALQ